jgi:hypothetical protein
MAFDGIGRNFRKIDEIANYHSRLVSPDQAGGRESMCAKTMMVAAWY